MHDGCAKRTAVSALSSMAVAVSQWRTSRSTMAASSGGHEYAVTSLTSGTGGCPERSK